MAYDLLTLTNRTATTLTFNLSDAESFAEGYTVSLYNLQQTTVLQQAITDSNGNATFVRLTPETGYYAYYSDAGYTGGTTLADKPREAMESQWADLASKVKAKADSSSIGNATITITNNGATVDSFTTNASSAKTIALSAPVITVQSTDPGEGVALAANNFIAVYSAS